MRIELKKKIDQSLRLLKSIPQDKGPIILAYSGGKDSDVCLELCKMAGIPFKAVYHSTTIDPAGTIKHVQDNGAEIMRPKKPFFALVRENGFPSRFARWCCRMLKEYYDADIIVQGIRASESRKRAERYREPEQCRIYDKKHKSRVYMPILYWDDEDIAEFVEDRNIKCHALYYEGGTFDATKRLGCIGCPLQSRKNRIRQFEQNPKYVKLYIKNAQVWYDAHTENEKQYKHNNAINAFVAHLFFGSFADYEAATYTIYGKTDWKKHLENYFGIDLSDIGMAGSCKQEPPTPPIKKTKSK